MKVHRFMSETEYQKLIAGEVLINTTDHLRDRKRSTTSKGFCFFTDEPDDAIHWLCGCTYPDCCVTMEIPDEMLTESYGIYRDTQRDDQSGIEIPIMKKREYCLKRYSLQDGVKVMAMHRRYAQQSQIRRRLIELGIIEE